MQHCNESTYASALLSESQYTMEAFGERVIAQPHTLTKDCAGTGIYTQKSRVAYHLQLRGFHVSPLLTMLPVASPSPPAKALRSQSAACGMAMSAWSSYLKTRAPCQDWQWISTALESLSPLSQAFSILFRLSQNVWWYKVNNFLDGRLSLCGLFHSNLKMPLLQTASTRFWTRFPVDMNAFSAL